MTSSRVPGWVLVFFLSGVAVPSSAAARDKGSSPATPSAPTPAPAPATAPSEPEPVPSDEHPGAPPELVTLDRSLRYTTGEVAIGDRLATVRLPPSLRYLDPAQTERVLVAWGNPRGSTTLGAIFPADRSPLLDEGTWAIVLSYANDGHVDDSEASSLDFNATLREMQTATEEENASRRQAGLHPVRLAGWAEPPHYDASTHVLYWAKDLVFGDSPQHTLNYSVRFLGRTGVLEMNAVADLGQLAEMKTQTAALLPLVAFQQGQRYGDFMPGADRVAAYGFGALIAGKVAAKAGLFKVLIAALVAGKKVIVGVVIAAVAGLKNLLGRKDRGSNGQG